MRRLILDNPEITGFLREVAVKVEEDLTKQLKKAVLSDRIHEAKTLAGRIAGVTDFLQGIERFDGKH